MNISGEQFHQGEMFGYSQNSNQKDLSPHREVLPDAPPNYYKHGRDSQLALPGMESTIQDHINALEDRTGGNAHYEHDPLTDQHTIAISDDRWPNASQAAAHGNGAYLVWSGHRASDPGEIQMVQAGEHRGEAAAMHATARRISQENAMDVPTPRHSVLRTPEGMQWSRKEMKKYGEQVW